VRGDLSGGLFTLSDNSGGLLVRSIVDSGKEFFVFVKFFEYFLMKRVIFLSIRIDLGYDAVKVGIRSERPFAYELFTTSGTLLVARPKRSNDAVMTESVQTLFGGHGGLQDFQTDRTHELILKDIGRHGYLGLVVDNFVRNPIQLVDV